MNLYTFTTLTDADNAITVIDTAMTFGEVTVRWDVPAEGTYETVPVWTVHIPSEWMAANPGLIDDSGWVQIDDSLIVRPAPEEDEIV